MAVHLHHVQASILHYAQRITSAASDGAPVIDCVIVVPPFFGPAQRQGLIDAAQLAGMASASPLLSFAPLNFKRPCWSSLPLDQLLAVDHEIHPSPIPHQAAW